MNSQFGRTNHELDRRRQNIARLKSPESPWLRRQSSFCELNNWAWAKLMFGFPPNLINSSMDNGYIEVSSEPQL